MLGSVRLYFSFLLSCHSQGRTSNFYIRAVNEVMDFLLLSCNGERRWDQWEGNQEQETHHNSADIDDGALNIKIKFYSASISLLPQSQQRCKKIIWGWEKHKVYVDGCHLKVCPTKSFLVIRFLQKDINHSKTFYLVKILYSYPNDIFHCQVFNFSFLNIMLVPRCLKHNFEFYRQLYP